MTKREMHADVVVIGGGMGGVAAAAAAAQLGMSVVLTEEHPMLGGQLTSQGVPPDENSWIEGRLTSPSYRRLRNRARDFYRQNYPLKQSVRDEPLLNPGLGRVSRLCAEPAAFEVALNAHLAPLQSRGSLRVFRNYLPISVEVDGDHVTAVVVRSTLSQEELVLTASTFVDATETGELLALGGVEYVVGSESQDQTGELHAPGEANPMDQQAITWCFALDYLPDEDHTIDKPKGYEGWLARRYPFWPGSQLSWTDVDPITLRPRTMPLFTEHPEVLGIVDRWTYRRLLAKEQFEPGYFRSDIAVVNWPQNDYHLAPIVDVPESSRDQALAEARDLSLSLLYWMQTEAPRNDGGTGYRSLRLRGDVLGSTDGLALAPYIRESRRIRAQFTVTEAHIGMEMRGKDSGSAIFADSIGIGYYGIDLHPSTGGRTYIDIPSFPYQIPLGALIPVRVRNLLPANKNIGTTHISNGAYRLHPTEWSIGEAAGALAAFAINIGERPGGVWGTPTLLAEFQQLMTSGFGTTLSWPDEVRTNPLHRGQL